jgi:hypothetical protein
MKREPTEEDEARQATERALEEEAEEPGAKYHRLLQDPDWPASNRAARLAIRQLLRALR